MELVGASGHIQVQVHTDEHGEPYIRIEHVEHGEVIDLPDLATARETHQLLARAITRIDSGT